MLSLSGYGPPKFYRIFKIIVRVRLVKSLGLLFILFLSLCLGLFAWHKKANAAELEITDFAPFFERYIALGQAISIFNWDIETGVAPVGSLETRAKTIAVLSAELFSMSTSEEMGNFFKAVERAIERNTADDITLGTCQILKREYDKLTCIPADEYKAYSELTTIAAHRWREAKGENNYGIFSPYLQEIIDYQRRFINYRQRAGMVFENPYDALLDDFEPGVTSKKLDVFFEELKASIVPLLHNIMSLETDTGKSHDILYREVPIQVQKNVSELIMKTVGYDLKRGVLRESAHPFSMGLGQSDVRITTNYHPNKFFASFYSVMHECGHAIYEQNVAKELEGTILDSGSYMAIHESQSRFFENVFGRSLEFWKGIYDDFVIAADGHFDDVTAEELHRAVNMVRPSLIRVEADELTYSLHIMVRYEIERMIFNIPDLKVGDLPALWNEKMRDYLGVTPATYSEGILQDIHWSLGYFGYFPSYALGSAKAAQIQSAMKKDFNVDAAIRALDVATINAWLTDKVHKHGRMLNSAEIMAQISDKGFMPKYYIEYLSRKYAELYKISH